MSESNTPQYKLVAVPADFEVPEEWQQPEDITTLLPEEVVAKHPAFRKVVKESIDRKNKIRELQKQLTSIEESPTAEETQAPPTQPQIAKEVQSNTDIQKLIDVISQRVVESINQQFSQRDKERQQLDAQLEEFPSAFRDTVKKQIEGLSYNEAMRIIETTKTTLSKIGVLKVQSEPVLTKDTYEQNLLNILKK